MALWSRDFSRESLFLTLDRNRKPCMKSLWYPGYIHPHLPFHCIWTRTCSSILNTFPQFWFCYFCSSLWNQYGLFLLRGLCTLQSPLPLLPHSLISPCYLCSQTCTSFLTISACCHISTSILTDCFCIQNCTSIFTVSATKPAILSFMSVLQHLHFRLYCLFLHQHLNFHLYCICYHVCTSPLSVCFFTHKYTCTSIFAIPTITSAHLPLLFGSAPISALPFLLFLLPHQRFHLRLV